MVSGSMGQPTSVASALAVVNYPPYLNFSHIYFKVFSAGYSAVFSARKASLHNVHCVLIALLSTADILVALFSAVVTPISIIVKVWMFGPHLCPTISFMQVQKKKKKVKSQSQSLLSQTM